MPQLSRGIFRYLGMDVSNDWLIKKARGYRTRYLKKHWRSLLPIPIGAVVALLAAHLIVGSVPSLRWLVGFLDGLVLAGAAGGWWFIANEFDGGKNSRNGLFGETQTVAALRRRPDWKLFHVGFDNVDADVVAVSEAGIFVFESKYTSGEWQVSDRLDGPIGDPISQCHFVARKIRLLLFSYGITIETTPVLVLWGPQLRHGTDPIAFIDGAQVVMGAASRDWLNLLKGNPIDPATAKASIEALAHYTAAFQPKPATAA